MVHSQLSHDNVVRLHEYTESEDEFVMFMEYCNDAEYFDNKIVEVSQLEIDSLSLIHINTTMKFVYVCKFLA